VFRCNYTFLRDITRSFLSLFYLADARPRIDSVFELFNICWCDGFVSLVTAFDNMDSIGKSLPESWVFPLKAIFLQCYEALSTFHLSQSAGIFPHVFRIVSTDWFYPMLLLLKYKTYSNTSEMIYDFLKQKFFYQKMYLFRVEIVCRLVRFGIIIDLFYHAYLCYNRREKIHGWCVTHLSHTFHVRSCSAS